MKLCYHYKDTLLRTAQQEEKPLYVAHADKCKKCGTCDVETGMSCNDKEYIDGTEVH